MSKPILVLSQQDVTLIRELLHKDLPKLDAVIADATACPQEIRKARLSKQSVQTYLQAEPDKDNSILLPPALLQALVYNIRMALCGRAAVMLTLLHDESLPSDTQLQLAQDAAGLLRLIRTFQDESLPGTVTSSVKQATSNL